MDRSKPKQWTRLKEATQDVISIDWLDWMEERVEELETQLATYESLMREAVPHLQAAQIGALMFGRPERHALSGLIQRVAEAARGDSTAQETPTEPQTSGGHPTVSAPSE